MRLAPLLLLAACAVAPLRTSNSPLALEARQLEGTWHVGGTTFPMWRDGTKTAPRFEYSRLETRDGVTTMDDRVSYLEAGKPGAIEGIDTQSPDVPTHFTWRGRGLLGLFRSDWDVVFVDPKGRFAIITFSRTLATPAGLDVISRGPLTDEAWNEALAEIDAQGALRSLAAGLQRI